MLAHACIRSVSHKPKACPNTQCCRCSSVQQDVYLQTHISSMTPPRLLELFVPQHFCKLQYHSRNTHETERHGTVWFRRWRQSGRSSHCRMSTVSDRGVICREVLEAQIRGSVWKLCAEAAFQSIFTFVKTSAKQIGFVALPSPLTTQFSLFFVGGSAWCFWRHVEY